MNTMSERDMWVRIAGDIKGVGGSELSRIAVSGGEPRHHSLTLVYPFAAKLEVADGQPQHAL